MLRKCNIVMDCTFWARVILETGGRVLRTAELELSLAHGPSVGLHVTCLGCHAMQCEDKVLQDNDQGNVGCRLVNLELLLKFGPNAWRVFNEQLENYVARWVQGLQGG